MDLVSVNVGVGLFSSLLPVCHLEGRKRVAAATFSTGEVMDATKERHENAERHENPEPDEADEGRVEGGGVAVQDRRAVALLPIRIGTCKRGSHSRF